jgi:hypothetical protein
VAAVAAARAHGAAALRALGFAVRERPFDYSALPGRFGTPLAGSCSPRALALAGTPATAGSGPVLALGALAARWRCSRWAARGWARRGVLDAPVLRARGVNLEAVRGRRGAAVWLVAHLDSKSQPVPMALRVGGVVASALAVLSAAASPCAQLGGVAGARAGGRRDRVRGARPLPGDRHHRSARARMGALDNASGRGDGAGRRPPAAALTCPVGVLLPSAEELGLAGARVGARTGGRGSGSGVALNVDGVDDHGCADRDVVGAYTRGRRPARRDGRWRRGGPGAVPAHRPGWCPGSSPTTWQLADAGGRR